MNRLFVWRPVVLLLMASTCLFADSIYTGVETPSDPGSPVLWNPGSAYQWYSFLDGTGYTTPFDDLGLTPGTFLFTPNTFFAFTGTPIVSIIELNDPNPGSLGPSGPFTTQSGVPEPRSFWLLATALFGFAALRLASTRYRSRSSAILICSARMPLRGSWSRISRA